MLSSIEVVLPTYNGVAFLEQQIESIAAQTVRPRRLLIRDDGSTDGTLELLKDLSCRYIDWIVLLSDDERLGCIANVNRLLEFSTAPYVALADQDDLWDDDKLERSLNLLIDLECRHGCQIPLVVHSDLRLIDAEGKCLGKSFLATQRLNPYFDSLHDLFITNVVTGCTVVLNRACIRLALPIPLEALMHDWWLALVATAHGKVGFLPDSTISYRQHDSNQLGATGLGWNYWRERFRSCSSKQSPMQRVQGVLNQARAFESRFAVSALPLLTLMNTPRQLRWILLLLPPSSTRPRKHGIVRTVFFYIILAAIR